MEVLLPDSPYCVVLDAVSEGFPVAESFSYWLGEPVAVGDRITAAQFKLIFIGVFGAAPEDPDMQDGGISDSGALPYIKRMMQFSWQRNTL